MASNDPLAPPGGDRIAFGPFCLSPAERLLTKHGKPVEIGGRSFDILAVLTERPGRVVSKRELLKRVWSDVIVEDGSLRFHMAGLRKILGEGENGGRYIATQVGVGYAFVAPFQRLVPDDGAGATEPTSRPLGDEGQTSGADLPPRVPRILGRDADLDLLVERIGNAQLLTIVGPAGVGKTTVAVELAYRLAASFESHAFVDLSLIDDPELVPQFLAGAMGITVHGDDPLPVILGHVEERKLLLIFDNCEHVIEAASKAVERILASAHSVNVVATSREPMRIRMEQVHRLDAHAYASDPNQLSLDELLTYPAIELFRDRALAAGMSEPLDERGVRLIADMCKRLDGMALAIELAAVRSATHGLEATSALLGERFSLGWQGHRNAPRRQQTLQAMLDWSYNLLGPAEQLVLARLSVFVGAFSIDAALKVAADDSITADEAAAALDELASKSLVVTQRSDAVGTYRLLEMTRAYARDKLLTLSEDEQRSTARRHASYLLGEIGTAAAEDAESLLDARNVREQLGNIRAALEWSFGPEGDVDLAVELASASARVFLTVSSLTECRLWCGRAIASLPEALVGSAVELELQAGLGTALMFARGNSEGAGVALARALEVASMLDDRWNQLRLLGRLHIFHERLGEYGTAFRHAERAVTVAKELGEPDALGIAYSLSGISRHLSGDQNQARRDLELSLANNGPSKLSRTIHYGFDHRNRSTIALARTLWLVGRPEQALRMARDAVAEAARLDHAVTHCIALLWSFSVLLWAEQFEDAKQALDAFAHCAETNALGPYISAIGGLRAELAVEQGLAANAVAALQESLSRLRAARYELLTTPFSLALARALTQEGRIEEADEVLRATVERCTANGEEVLLPELLRSVASLLNLQDQKAEAASVLERAISTSQEQGSAGWTIRASNDLTALRTKLPRAS